MIVLNESWPTLIVGALSVLVVLNLGILACLLVLAARK